MLRPDELVDRIYASYESREADATPRTYLGASSIGAGLACARRAWYQFRHLTPEEFDGRLLRLFQHGHVEETRIIDDLRRIGFEVVAHIGPDQIGVRAYNGLVRGHIDGLVREAPDAPWHLLECKTANDRSWRELEKKGVAEAKPVHYAQIQVYLGLLQVQFQLEGDAPTSCVYVALNKNNERLYVEHVAFDAEAFGELGALASRILEATDPPERPISVPDKRVCMFCPSSGACWDGEETARVCGGCQHYRVDIDQGEFRCDLHGRQTRAYETCENYTTRPSVAPQQATLEGWYQ